MHHRQIMDLGKIHSNLEDIILVKGVGLSSNIYIIQGQLIVDTGTGELENNISTILTKMGLVKNNIETVVLTHSHFDHIGGVEEFKATSKVMAHHNEHEEIKSLTDITPLSLTEGDLVKGGKYIFHVYHTPGHTSGSICLYEKKTHILLSGDTIFPYGGFGRTDLPTGNTNALLDSIKKLTKLPSDHLLPGHDDPIVEDASKHVFYSLKNIENLLI
jgi:hydroxyacylglutathione hydrolase